MKLIRIGGKIISEKRVAEAVAEILQRRSNGHTQQEVADEFGIERSFISYLEGIGEVRRGKKVALVGFPVKNKEEIEQVARECGVDFVYLLNKAERITLGGKKKSSELFDEILEVLAKLKDYDLIVLLAYSGRISKLQKILGREIVGVSLGHLPLRKNKYVEPHEIRDVLTSLAVRKEAGVEEDSRRKLRLFEKRSQSTT